MSSPVRELDERATELGERLKGILTLYLAGQLTYEIARALGEDLITETYIDLVVYLRIVYVSPKGYNAENKRLLKILEKIREDFYDVLSKRGKQTSEEQLKNRLSLIALTLVYSLYNTSIVEIAIIRGITWIRWNVTEMRSRNMSVLSIFQYIIRNRINNHLFKNSYV